MSVLARLLVACLAPQNPPAPMATLVSSYTFGDQLSLEVRPDDGVAFVAEGAAITMLSLTTPTATVLAKVPLPNCQPLSQKYYRHPVTLDSWLFIAGGTEGLWRLSICHNLTSSPPQICSLETFSPELVQLVDGPSLGFNQQPASLERKRCVAVAVLD